MARRTSCQSWPQRSSSFPRKAAKKQIRVVRGHQSRADYDSSPIIDGRLLLTEVVPDDRLQLLGVCSGVQIRRHESSMPRGESAAPTMRSWPNDCQTLLPGPPLTRDLKVSGSCLFDPADHVDTDGWGTNAVPREMRNPLRRGHLQDRRQPRICTGAEPALGVVGARLYS